MIKREFNIRLGSRKFLCPIHEEHVVYYAETLKILAQYWLVNAVECCFGRYLILALPTHTNYVLFCFRI